MLFSENTQTTFQLKEDRKNEQISIVGGVGSSVIWHYFLFVQLSHSLSISFSVVQFSFTFLVFVEIEPVHTPIRSSRVFVIVAV